MTIQKKKIVSLALATLLPLNSFAAGVDRTQGIAEQEVAVAQGQLQALRSQMLSLDGALASSESKIRGDDRSALLQLSNVAEVASTAVGIGLGTISTVLLVRGNHNINSAIFTALAGLASTAATVLSAISGEADRRLSPRDLIGESVQNMEVLKSNLANAEVKTADEKKAISDLLVSISTTQKSLQNLQLSKDEQSTKSAYIHVAQTVAVATQVAGYLVMNSRAPYRVQKAGEKTIVLGLVGASIASTVKLLTLVEGSRKEEVLQEIQATRGALRQALVQLN